MKQAKRERLESKGWKIGTVSDFLELIPFLCEAAPNLLISYFFSSKRFALAKPLVEKASARTDDSK